MKLIAFNRQRKASGSRPTSPPRLTVELLEARNLMDSGLANILVNDPTLDVPVLLTLPDGSTSLTTRDTQSETTLVLGSGNRVIVAYNDSGSEIYFNGTPERVGFAVSMNGGNSFKDQGHLPVNSFGSFFDPVLARSNRTGTIFLTTLAWTRDSGDFTGRINIFRSLDEGSTFELPVNGTPGFVPGVDLQDKPWIVVDNFSGPDGSGYGNAYLAWTDYSNENGKSGLYLTRSTGDGADGTWGPDGGTLIARGTNKDDGNVPIDAYVTVGRDHAVYVFWLDYYGLSLQMRKSTDQGVTFSEPVIVAKLEKHSHNADLGLTDSHGNVFRADSAPQAVVNPANGDIYLIYADKPNGPKDRADIFFVQSTDGGQTWTPRRRVNDDATNTDQWQPAMAVTPDGDRVGIFWYDRRLDPGNNLIDRFGVIATVSGSTVTFGQNFRITDVSFPPAFGEDTDVNSKYMGDYDQVVADNDYFYTTWGDNRLANPNYAPHVNQPDVRFVKIPVDWASGGSLLLAASAPHESQIVSATATPVLSPGELQPFLDAALTHWQAAGADIAALATIDVRFADVGGATLGMASGNTIWIDHNAAGWGWFVDPTPWDDSEFTTPGNQGEQNRMDLLTVLAHELGHLLGYGHDEGVMADTLTVGERHVPGALCNWEQMLFALATVSREKR